MQGDRKDKSPAKAAPPKDTSSMVFPKRAALPEGQSHITM
jgi:hypothetical protein